MQHENLADISHKLSIIYKHIQLMHNELRYQAKTHTISEKLSKEKIKFCIFSPNFFFFFFFFFKKKKQQGHAYGKRNDI
jgi:hypothetical protein